MTDLDAGARELAESHNAQKSNGDSTARRSIGARLADYLLTLAAVGGALCILLVIAALLFDISLIMFKTGSMSPTIPAGAVAVVREIPASEVEVGDVVTVDRPGLLPVTHRVQTVQQGADGLTVLTLKGDANLGPDPYPYSVSSVRVVLWSVPGLAAFLVWASNPLVLGMITLAVTALVIWAFWPRSGQRAGGKHRNA